MDLGEQAHRVNFMIRDRGPNFTATFVAVLADAGVRTLICNVRTPRMKPRAAYCTFSGGKSTWPAHGSTPSGRGLTQPSARGLCAGGKRVHIGRFVRQSIEDPIGTGSLR